MATSYIGTVVCNVLNGNTNVPSCSFDITQIDGMMLVPKGYKITQTEIQTLQTVLLAKAWHTTESLRGYPIWKFIGIEDKSSETSINTTGYGGKTFGRKGKFEWIFEYKKGGMNYDIMLSTFENSQDSYDVLLFDSTMNTVIGTTPDTNSSNYVLQGFSLELLYNPLPKLDNEGTKHYIGIALADTWELMGKMALYTLPPTQRITSIIGLNNLEISYSSLFAGGGTSGLVRITTGYYSTGIGSTYSTALATLGTSWTVVSSTGTNYAVSGVAYSSSTDLFTLTIAALPATGTEITVYTPTVTQMSATIPGYAQGQVTFKTV